MIRNKKIKIINDMLDEYFRKYEYIGEVEGDECAKINKLMKLYDILARQIYRVIYAIPYPVFVRDKQKNIYLWGELMEQLTGYSKNEVIGKKCYEILKTSICDNCMVEKCLELKTEVKNKEIFIKDKKNEDVLVLFSTTGIYDDDSELDLGFVIMQNITDEKKLMNNIQQVAKNVSASAQQLSATSEESISFLCELANYTNQVSEIVNKSKEKSTQTMEIANEGQNAAYTAIEKIQFIKNAVKDLSEVISNMNSHGNEVNKILDLINDITEQTNLLALNAAIEAARAGEAGKGFAVVADEVRRLAEQSKDATTQVQDIIGQVLEGAENSRISMETVNNEVNHGGEVLNNTILHLKKIISEVMKLDEYIEEIFSNSSKTAAFTEEQLASMEQIASSAENLAQIADILNKEVHHFSLQR